MKNLLTIIIAGISLCTYAQNVGIGTSAPNTKLEVSGAISSTPSSGTAGATITIPANVSIFRITDDGAGAANAITVTSPQEGQYLTIYNADAQAATFAGFTIEATTGVISCTYINGAWRLVSNSNGFIKNQAVNAAFTTGQTAASYDITGNAEIGGTMNVNGPVGIGNVAPGSNLLNVSTAAATSGAGNGISLTAQQGSASGNGGPITIQSGSGGTTSGAGGNIQVIGGSGIAGNSGGGAVNITAGNGSGTSSGGAVSITSGIGGSSSGAGGSITITPGASSGTTSGAITIISGGAAGGVAQGGTLLLRGGSAAAAAGSNGGAVNIVAAAGSTTGTGGNGGGLSFNAGNAGGTGNNTGGSATFFAGTSTGNATGGTTSVGGGHNSGTGAGGTLNLFGGWSGSTGAGGAVGISGGNGGATSGNGGAISLSGGLAAGSTGTGGAVSITSGNGGSTSGVAGNIGISCGSSFGNNAGANASFSSGNGSGNGAGGTLRITGGGGGTTSGAGGDIQINGGSAFAGNSTGGFVSISAGNGAGTSAGGSLNLYGGSSGNAAGAAGGPINLIAGTGTNTGTGGVGGAVSISAGNAQGTGNNNGGNILLTPGTATGTGTAGNVGIATGSSPTNKLDVNGSIRLRETNYNLSGASPSQAIARDISQVWLSGSPTGTIALTTTSPQDGQRLVVYNSTPIPATLASKTINAGEAVEFIYSNTAWRSIADGSLDDWSTTGNAGTTVGGNFIGTTDANNLKFKVNNNFSGLIEHDGTLQTHFGYLAGANSTANFNTSFGWQALAAVNSGISNSAFGLQALNANTTGYFNTAMGGNAAALNQNGFSNTAIGYYALITNVSGIDNAALGVQTLYKTAGLNDGSQGSKNTGFGSNAGYSITTGNDNVALGYYAMNIGTTNNITGSRNVAIGSNAGNVTPSAASSASNNTFIGYLANTTLATLTNSTAIGSNAQVTTSNSMVLGSINGVNGATSSTNVGIGITAPASSLHLVQAVATTGSPSAFRVVGGAHTTLAASTEATDVDFNLNRTVQFAAGAIGTQRAVRIQAPTYAFGGASTITDAATLSISGAPAAGTNATITNPAALIVESGRVGFGTTAPKGILHTYGAFNYFQSSGGSGGTAFTSANTIPLSNGNGFNGYGGLVLMPRGWGNATTIDDHTAVYIGGAQRTSGSRSSSLVFANWGYFTGTGGAAGQLGNATAQGDAVKFRIENIDVGGAFTQRLDFGSRSASGTNVTAMSILSNGNVGIGNINPTSTLHVLQPLATTGSPSAFRVDGGAHTTLAASIEASDVTFALNRSVQFATGAIATQRAIRILAPTYAFVGASTITDAATLSINAAPLAGTNATITNPAALIVESGRVGFGTTAPGYPLDIAGTTVDGPNQNYRWFTQNNANNSTITSSTITPNQTNGTNHGRISLRAAGSIWASGGGFYASSDTRAKNNIETKNSLNSLALINKLNVVKYNWIDATKSNHEFEDGFIAQEVEKIIPQAVNKATDFLPNVYALADNYSISNEALHISMSKEYDLQKGDLVKFHTEDGKEHRLNVIDAKGTQYSFALTEEAKNISGKLFVYGKEVNDFNTVDYDRIFTIGISAIQELSKKVDALEKENASLKSENREIMKSLKAQIDIINERLSIKTEK